MKKTNTELLPLGVLLCLLCLAILWSGRFQRFSDIVAYAAFGVSLTVFFVSLALERRRAKAMQKRMDDVFAENSEISTRLVNQVGIPCALIESDGKIAWRNESMKKIYTETDICRAQPHFDFFRAARRHADGTRGQYLSGHERSG